MLAVGRQIDFESVEAVATAAAAGLAAPWLGKRHFRWLSGPREDLPETLSCFPRSRNADRMRQLLKTSLALAMARLQELAGTIRIESTDESTFRSLLVREIMVQERLAWCGTEWSKKLIDLLVALGTRHAVVELKYYIYRSTYDLDRNHLNWRACPSSHNEKEFKQCVNQLDGFEHDRVTDRFLVLLYERGNRRGPKSRNTYEKSYDDLDKYGIAQNRVTEIDHAFDGLACKPIECPVPS